MHHIRLRSPGLAILRSTPRLAGYIKLVILSTLTVVFFPHPYACGALGTSLLYSLVCMRPFRDIRHQKTQLFPWSCGANGLNATGDMIIIYTHALFTSYHECLTYDSIVFSTNQNLCADRQYEGSTFSVRIHFFSYIFSSSLLLFSWNSSSCFFYCLLLLLTFLLTRRFLPISSLVHFRYYCEVAPIPKSWKSLSLQQQSLWLL